MGRTAQEWVERINDMSLKEDIEWCWENQVNSYAIGKLAHVNDTFPAEWQPSTHKPGGRCGCSPLKTSSGFSAATECARGSKLSSMAKQPVVSPGFSTTLSGSATDRRPPPRTKEEEFSFRLTHLQALKAVDPKIYQKAASDLSVEIFGACTGAKEDVVVSKQAAKPKKKRVFKPPGARPFGISRRKVFGKPKHLVKKDWSVVVTKLFYFQDGGSNSKQVNVFNKVPGIERTSHELEVASFAPQQAPALIADEDKDEFADFKEEFEEHAAHDADLAEKAAKAAAETASRYSDTQIRNGDPDDAASMNWTTEVELEWLWAPDSPKWECLICKPDAEGKHSIATRANSQFLKRGKASLAAANTAAVDEASNPTKRKRHNLLGQNQDAPVAFECYCTNYQEPAEHCKQKCHYYGVAAQVKDEPSLQGWTLLPWQRDAQSTRECMIV